MDFTFDEDLRRIDEAVRKVCEPFDKDYWRSKDERAEFPHEFRAAMAEGGWLGITLPAELGGAGLGLCEAAVMMHAVANAGGGMSAASAIHMNLFGPHPVVVFGSPEQKSRWLPDLCAGRVTVCFAVTEPDAGLDTSSIKTRAERRGDDYVINGRKVWTSTAQVADKILLLARSAEAGTRPTDGMSLFYTDLDRSRIEVRLLEKMGRHAVDSNLLFIDDLVVPASDRIGEEGQGFRYLLHSLNPERVLVAAEAVAIGRLAVEWASRYAKERIVFGRPIGQNQAIQHPLARSWMELEGAWLACLRAAWTYDQGLPCGAEANTAKFLAGEAAFSACERSLMAHGGMGYAREFHIERLMREVFIPRLAPVSPELILCYIAEKVLGLPKSY